MTIPKPLAVLIVEDSKSDAQLIVRLLKKAGYEVVFEQVETATQMRAALEKRAWDIVISDYHLPQFDGRASLTLLQESGQDIPFIVVSGAIGEETAVAMMQAGAHDYLMKGSLARLAPAVERELAQVETRRERKRAEEETRRNAARAEALVRTAARLNTDLDLDAVLNSVCEETARALGVPIVTVSLYDETQKSLFLRASFGLTAILHQRIQAVSRTVLDEYNPAASSVVVTPDVQVLTNLPNADIYAEMNLRTTASVNMLRRGQLIGRLNIGTLGEMRHFTDDELALLGGLADQAAQALANAQLYTERVQAEERIETQLQRLAALRAIDTAITGSLDLQLVLNIILDQMTAQLKVDAVSVLLFNPHLQMLEYAAGCGFRSRAVERTRFRIGEGQAGLAALERRLIQHPDFAASGNTFAQAELLTVENVAAYFALPLIVKGEVKGVLEVFHRSVFHPGLEWINFLETLAGQAAIAIDSAQLFENLQSSNTDLIHAYDRTIEGWSHALDLRDEETEGHSQRVTEITLRLAKAMGIGDAELVHVRRGALLHDIGKMGVPDGILLKPGSLTDEEWVLMRKHPEYAYDLLSPIAYLRDALDIPYCHHEKWDGSGYPRGLKGEQIPLAARIFAIVDVWDALRSERPYRPAWAIDKVRAHIQSLAGTHFDPNVVPVFLELMEKT